MSSHNCHFVSVNIFQTFQNKNHTATFRAAVFMLEMLATGGHEQRDLFADPRLYGSAASRVMFAELYSLLSQRDLREPAAPLPPQLSHLIRPGTRAVGGMEWLPWRTVHVEGHCLKTGSWRSATRANPITSSESAGGKLKDCGKSGWGRRAKTGKSANGRSFPSSSDERFYSKLT